jgi:hypothetical protein
MPNVIAMASAPPTVTRKIGRRGFAPPSRAATQPVIASASNTAATVTGMRADAGGRRIAMSGSSAPVVHRGRDRGQPGICQLLWINSQLEFRVGGERIVSGQFLGGLARGLRGETSCLVKAGQLVQLGIGLEFQFLAFSVQQCPFGVALSADRHIFANRHRQRAGGQPGDAGSEHRLPFGGGSGDADDNASRRDDPIVGAQDAGPKPVEFIGDRTVVWLRRTRLAGAARSVRCHGLRLMRQRACRAITAKRLADSTRRFNLRAN